MAIEIPHEEGEEGSSLDDSKSVQIVGIRKHNIIDLLWIYEWWLPSKDSIQLIDYHKAQQ